MIKKIRSVYRDYKALFIISVYSIIYLTIFSYLENRNVPYHVIRFGLDSYIPFCEYFIIPYLLWFAYVAVTVVWLCFKDKYEAKRLVIFLIAGMTVFLIISAIYPNGHHLRPKYFSRDNIFIDLVKRLYMVDTSTNVLPSIHVYNSVAIMIAVWRTTLLKDHKVIKGMMLLLGISIIFSTVLLKQHSMLDVLTGLLLSLIMYVACYRSYIFSENRELQDADVKYKY